MDGTNEMIDIGGAMIPKSVDDFAKSGYSRQPSHFFRQLIFKGGLFTLEEIAGSSLTGAGSSHSPAEPRPALNPALLKILKEYTIHCCGLQRGSAEMLAFQNSLRNICTDARRKLKRVSTANLNEYKQTNS